jgi:hypothetical protein
MIEKTRKFPENIFEFCWGRKVFHSIGNLGRFEIDMKVLGIFWSENHNLNFGHSKEAFERMSWG